MVISVIGGGLAGCEAAYRIAEMGVQVRLYEMKPQKYSPAHSYSGLAELVCSNSLKAMRLESAAGLLKAEMTRMGSLILKAAEQSKVAAGGALAVDRYKFSDIVTDQIRNHPLIEVVSEEVTDIPEGICVIATGPLTSDAFSTVIAEKLGEGHLSFFDAAAPIIEADSLDMDKVFAAARYDRGDDDYLNCPLEKDEYYAFVDALLSAERATLKEWEDITVYEGCMPIEILASRGRDSLRFGPMKPVGLTDPRTDRRPYAVLQLRKEDSEGVLYNMVGFQTNLKFPEQRRVFGMIPGLESATYVRYGVMHRNTFINSPKLLNTNLSLKQDSRIFFAGQITGVEGYTESAMCGIVAGYNAAALALGKQPLTLPTDTMSGALLSYATESTAKNFQPMGSNMGILPPLETKIKDKQARYAALAERAMKSLEETLGVQGFGEQAQNS